MTTARVPTSHLEALVRAAVTQARRQSELRAHVDEHRDERESLMAYIPAVHKTDDRPPRPAYPPAHLQTIVNALEDDSLGHTVIIAPPGSAKTNTAMAYNAWLAGRDPSIHLGYFTEAASQANLRSVGIRDTITQSAEYRAIFPDAEPNFGKGWSESRWFLQRPDVTDQNPTMLAAGVGGAVQGARLHRATYDDIASLKNMATPLQKLKVMTWLQTIAQRRLVPGSRSVMICTRWAADDPAGWAIKEGWYVIRIKAITDEGASYWPERFPLKTLDCTRAGATDHGQADPDWQPTPELQEPPCWIERDLEGRIVARGRCARSGMTAKDFNLVYQGETTDDASAIFKRAYWRYYGDASEIPRQRLAGQGLFVDTAHEEKTTSDFSVIAAWYWAPPNFYVREVIKRRLEFPELLKLLQDLTRARPETIDGVPHEKGRYAFWPVYIEDTPGAKPLIQSMQRSVAGVMPWEIEGRSKMARANAVAKYAEARNLWLPEGAPWVPDFVEEHAAFGTPGVHDDQVDTTTMALLRFTGGGALYSW